MSIDVSEKLKLMRESERLNRKEVSELTGVPYSSLSSYESRSKNAGVESIMKILQHPRFTKYTMWFMTDQIAPVGKLHRLSRTLGSRQQHLPTPTRKLANHLRRLFV